MDEPKRWLDDGPRDARDLLRLATKTRPMTREERVRTTSRVARIGATGMVLGGLAWMQGLAWGAGVGVVGVVGVAAVHFVPQWVAPARPASSPSATSASPARRAAQPPRARATAAEVVPADSPPAPHVEAAPSATLVGSPSSRALPSAGDMSAVPSPPRVAASDRQGPAEPERAPDLLAQEAALLDRARASLASNPGDALALTDAHAARFAHGALVMEREIVTIDALRRLGRVAEARARGEAFLARTDGGLYVDRVRNLIDEDR